MPEPVTPPAKAEATPQSTPPTQEQPPQSFLDDPMLETLRQDLGVMVEEQQKPKGAVEVPEIKPVEEPPPVAPAPTTETKPAAQKPAFAKRDRQKELDDLAARTAEETLKRLKASEPRPPLPPANPEEAITQQPAPVATEVDEDSLTPQQRKELEIARYAERVEPDKYKGKAEKLKAFYKAVDDYVAKHRDDEDRTFDENDDEYVRFIRENKPKWANGELEVLSERKIADAAAERARKELEPELQRLKKTAQEARAIPLIEKTMEGFERELNAKLTSSDPLEGEIFNETGAEFKRVTNEYLKIANGLSDFNPSDFAHNYLANFVEFQANHFAKHGGDALKRAGKTFVHPLKYQQLLNENDPNISKHWTFTPKDVVEMLAAEAVNQAKERVKAEEERAAKRGFQRVKQQPSPKPATTAPEPTPTSGPKITPTPAPGPTSQGAAFVDDNHPGVDIIKTLGLDQ